MHFSLETFELTFALASIATAIGAFSGGGLSLILLPFLIFSFSDQEPYLTLLTASKIGALTMSAVAAIFHRTRHVQSTRFLAWVTTGGVLGTALGTYLLQYLLEARSIAFLLAFIMVAAAVLLIRSPKGLANRDDIPSLKECIIGSLFIFVVYIFNGIFGGTGIFLTMFCIVALRMGTIQAVAYSMTSSAIVNVLHTLYLVPVAPPPIDIAFGVIVGTTLGTTIGTYVQYLKGNRVVKIATSVLLVFMATKVLMKTLG